jgi:hypothetical protein
MPYKKYDENSFDELRIIKYHFSDLLLCFTMTLFVNRVNKQKVYFQWGN